MRFHRSIKIFPGLRLNLSGAGLGLSAGVRGLRVGIDAKGRSYVNAGIPGTGLSVRKYAKTVAVPRGGSSIHLTPEPQKILASSAGPANTGVESKVMRKGVWAFVGIGVAVIAALIAISPRSENELATALLTSEQEASNTAERELARSHPEFILERITRGGPNPIRKTADGYEVQLHYLQLSGGFMTFVCEVKGMAAVCAPPATPPRPRRAASATPLFRRGSSQGLATTPALARSRGNIGPRGGVYHYSSSGRKVYERKNR